MRVGKYDPARVKLQDIMKLNYMNMDIVLKVGFEFQARSELVVYSSSCSSSAPQEDDRTFICGDVLILDMRGVTLSHAAQLQPSLLKRASTVYQDAYPVRPQGIHYVYPPPSFETMFNFIKSFMKEKLKKRVSRSDTRGLPYFLIRKTSGANEN